MTNNTKVLVIDDEEDIKTLFEEYFQDKAHAQKYQFSYARTGEQGLSHLKRDPSIRIVLLDIRMPDMDGFGLLNALREQATLFPRFRHAKIVLSTAYADLPNIRQAIKLGVCDVLTKPLDLDDAYEVLERLSTELSTSQALDTFIGNSKAIASIKETILGVAEHPVNIVIEGETGTGKSLLARLIHDCCPQRNRHEFVDLHCGALSSTLIESELFGHTKGAFTGAEHSRKGKFQLADHGTLFLDEISTLDIELQAKLLKALEQQTFYPVGKDSPVKVDVRTIAATNSPLQELVRQKKFREDLYYRLNVVTLKIPPLRERKEDIPLLVEHFLFMLNQKYQGSRPQKIISSEAIKKLLDAEWPGNTRGLFNVLESAFLLSIHAEIACDDIITKPLTPSRTRASHSDRNGNGFHHLTNWIESQLRQGGNVQKTFEHMLLQVAWKEYKGNKKQIASKLGISRSKLYDLLKEHNLSEIHTLIDSHEHQI